MAGSGWDTYLKEEEKTVSIIYKRRNNEVFNEKYIPLDKHLRKSGGRKNVNIMRVNFKPDLDKQ